MKLYGNYRALVVDNKDPENKNRIKVWIPDIMPEIDQARGLWARDASTPIGGRNEDNPDNNFAGQSFIPRKTSWVWIFFEQGNINRPYYWNAVNLENAKALPENQLGSEPQDKWVIFKSTEGRTIIVSDDDDDQRVEITGKKRKLTEPPSGDTASVYEIDENQTVILLDEREGKEKILIRSHKGDFLHFDIDERKFSAKFEGDVNWETSGKFNIKAGGNINLKSDAAVNIEGSTDVNVKGGSNVNVEGGAQANLKGGAGANVEGGGATNIKGGGPLNLDGSFLSLQQGAASGAGGASPADGATPEGERDT